MLRASLDDVTDGRPGEPVFTDLPPLWIRRKRAPVVMPLAGFATITNRRDPSS